MELTMTLKEADRLAAVRRVKEKEIISTRTSILFSRYIAQQMNKEKGLDY